MIENKIMVYFNNKKRFYDTTEWDKCLTSENLGKLPISLRELLADVEIFKLRSNLLSKQRKEK